jgi:glycosyltransferase involved in cell wall biosynthesis
MAETINVFDNNIKVSIIVPVYNVADYLRRCLDSCVNQTLREIEIVVVNDCSPDPRDTEIMKEYERRFPDKVRCIWHENNKLLGAARNTGIRSAHGKFVYCVDSDDYVDLELCEKMYNAIVSENADMAVCDTNYIEKNVIIKKLDSNGNFSTSDLCERIRNLKIHNTWLIMIKKSVIDDNDLYFPEQIEFEDLASILWYLASEKIVSVNEVLHYYCIRNNSIMREKKLQTYILSVKTTRYILCSDYFNNLDASVKKLVFLFLVRHILIWCQIVCVNYPTEFAKFCYNILDLFNVYKIDYDDDIYQLEDSIHIKKILRFIEQNINAPDFNLEFIAYSASCYTYQHKITELKKIRRLLSLYAGKRLTVWGCGALGRRNAENMSIVGIKFEITDVNTRIHGDRVTANAVVKPWNEVKEHTDVVLVSAKRIFEEVRNKLARECPDIIVIDLITLLEQ